MNEYQIPNGPKFTDDDVVNPDELNSWNNASIYVLHDHGFVVAVVIQSTLQDAIDEAVDSGKLDRYQITETDFADYLKDDQPTSEVDADNFLQYLDDEKVTYLGNACEPFDIESMQVIELPEPKMSICALFKGEQ